MRELRPLEDAISRLERVFATQRSVRVVAPLAEAYRIERRLGEAEATARDGIRDYPDSISIRVVLARSLRDQGRDTDAREAFREVVRLDPENMEALVFVGSTPDPRWENPLEPVEHATGREAPRPQEEIDAAPKAELSAESPRGAPEDDGLPRSEKPAAAVEPTSEPVSLTSELAHLSDLFGPSPPNPADRDGAGELSGIATLTLAEIYARQGLPDKAVEVCQQILAKDPENANALRRLEEYERALAESR